MARPTYESKVVKFLRLFEEETRKGLEGLDRRSMEALLAYLDFRVLDLQVTVLAAPDDIQKNAGRESALMDLSNVIAGIYDRKFLTPPEKKEEVDEDE